MDREIFVSADLGSSNLMLMAAERNEEGKLRVLALEKVPTPEESIQNGIIKKPSDIATKLRELSVKLANRIENKIGIKCRIDGMYFGINGRSLRTLRANVKRTYESETEITKTDLSAFKNELQNKPLEGRDIFALFEEEYIIDNDLLKSAEGRLCKDIQANYVVAYGRKDVRENLNKCLERAVIEERGMTLAPLAIANAVMTDEDKEKGCAVLNFGASTTTVAVFQGGYLRHIAVVPFGGRHITQDLKSLGISFKDAEYIKIKYGTADLKKSNSKVKLQLQMGPGVDPKIVLLKDVVEIVEARLSEIVDLCMTEIVQSRYKDQLQNGLIVTGGASNLQDFVPFLAKKCEMKVTVGSHETNLDETSKAEYSDKEYALLVGLLKNATESSVSDQINKNEKVGQKKGNNLKNPVKIISGMVDTLFSGNYDKMQE